jgi:hypothetical protein
LKYDEHEPVLPTPASTHLNLYLAFRGRLEIAIDAMVKVSSNVLPNFVARCHLRPTSTDKH